MLRRSVRVLCPKTPSTAAGTAAAPGASTTDAPPARTRLSGAEVAASFLGTIKNRRIITEPEQSESASPAAAAATPPPTTPAASATDAAATPVAAIPSDRLQALFASRRSPKNLYSQGMHSDTLSDHPVTMKMARDELSYKQRKLVERGQFEKAVDVEEKLESNDAAGKSGSEANEYRWVIFFLMLGYITAHFAVFNYYYPGDMRLSYDPKKGYIEDIERKEETLMQLDTLIQNKVLHYTFNTKRAAAKSKAQKHYEGLLQK